MNRRRMTQRLIDTLVPGKSVHEFRDTELRGSGRAGTGAKCRAGIPLFRDYVVNQRITGHCHRCKPLTRRTVESRLRSTRMNPKSRLTRFLLAEEIVRLHKALELCIAERLTCAGQAGNIALFSREDLRAAHMRRAGRHNSPPPVHRIPQERDQEPEMVRGGGRHAPARRQQDRSANGAYERGRARRHRTPEAGIGPFVFPSPSNSGKPFGKDLPL